MIARSADGLVRLDRDMRCLYASPAARRMLGRVSGGPVGKSLVEDLTDEDRTAVEAAISRMRGGFDGAEAVIRTTDRSGDQTWIEGRFAAVAEDGGAVVVLRDVSTRKTAELALRLANAELNRLAGSDGLTDLASRRRFDQVLDDACRRASRHNHVVSLLLIDVDRFRAFNDRHGIQAGDDCLRRIAAALRDGSAEQRGVAARFGGQEFAILLPNLDVGPLVEMAENIRRAVEALAILHDDEAAGSDTVTVSIGCATIRPHRDALATAAAALLAEADRSLYDAKRLGRNRVMTAAAPQADEAPLLNDGRRLGTVKRLRDAGLFAPAPSLDSVARMAAVLLDVPGAFIALIDRGDVAVIGRHGLGEEGRPISHRLCAQAIGARTPFSVPDVAADPRFKEWSTDGRFGFLAAAPLLAGDRLDHLGALWVFDRRSRPPLEDGRRVLLDRLARLIVEDLEARRSRSEGPAMRVA